MLHLFCLTLRKAGPHHQYETKFSYKNKLEKLQLTICWLSLLLKDQNFKRAIVYLLFFHAHQLDQPNL